MTMRRNNGKNGREAVSAAVLTLVVAPERAPELPIGRAAWAHWGVVRSNAF
jgi:hypothetical protein